MGMVRAQVCQNGCVQSAFSRPRPATRCEENMAHLLNVKINVSMHLYCLPSKGGKIQVGAQACDKCVSKNVSQIALYKFERDGQLLPRPKRPGRGPRG